MTLASNSTFSADTNDATTSDMLSKKLGPLSSNLDLVSHSDILHLAELVPVVRARFGLGDDFADDAILNSLRVIAATSDQRQRWLAAFNSNLGRSLASDGRDLNTALSALVALVPRPTS